MASKTQTVYLDFIIVLLCSYCVATGNDGTYSESDYLLR